MKKPILIVVLLLACANVGILIGYFISGQAGHVAVNSPLNSFTSTIVLDFGAEGTIRVPVIYQTSIISPKIGYNYGNDRPLF